MHRPAIAALTIIALSLLALCCQGMLTVHLHAMAEQSMELLPHTLLLIMNLPSATLLFSLFILILVLILILSLPSPNLQLAQATHHLPWVRPPDIFSRTPLGRALMMGILNPKPY